MATLSFGGIGRAALDLLYPPRCALCGSGGAFLCATCLEGLPRAVGGRCDACCDACWSPLDAHEACRACNEHPLALTHLRTAFRYEHDVRRLVHDFKFNGHSCLAPSLAAPMLATWTLAGLEADVFVFVPVPITGRRQRERGYNQAAMLAGELAKGVGVLVVAALRRTRFAGPQARSASAVERRRNVERAFEVALPRSIAGKRVALVDDITTTGSTLDACARALLAASATEVVALTLARED